MTEEVPYWSPPTLYVLSLKVVVHIIKECFSNGGLDCVVKADWAFPTSLCNHLVARHSHSFSSLKDQYSNSLLSAIVDYSPWCRLTKLHIKYSRDVQDYTCNDHWSTATLQRYDLTELVIECDASNCRNINLIEIGRELGDTLVSLTLKHCTVKHGSLQEGLSYLVNLEYLTLQYITFDEVDYQQKYMFPVLQCLEVMDLSMDVQGTTNDLCSMQVAEDMCSVQSSVKILQLYNIPARTEMFSLLSNLVVVDISRKLHTSFSLSSLNESALMVYLSGMVSLKSLDVSCREVTSSDVQLFDQPHHRMAFLGLFNTTPSSHQNINADKVTGDHTESQILLGLELYKQRYDYVYELLFSLANFHSPVVKNERALEAILELCNVYSEDGPLLVVATASVYLYLKGEDIEAKLKRSRNCGPKVTVIGRFHCVAHLHSEEKTIWILVDIMAKHKNYPRVDLLSKIYFQNLFDVLANDKWFTKFANFLLQPNISGLHYYLLGILFHPPYNGFPEKLALFFIGLCESVSLNSFFTMYFQYALLMQNCCICLYPYQTMQDSGFVLTKLATSLIYLVQHSPSLRTLFMALLGLSKLIWWLPKPKKMWLAKLNIIEITLTVLVDMNSLDENGQQENPLDLMEACWNILWNMTDECPENCVLFCDSKGIEVTLNCYQSHREAFEDAMPSIFGALGNVVEVEELQSKVMCQDVMLALREAVITDKHHRMCYSIGGVVANLAYNGDKFWGNVQPSRHSMLDFMVKEMQQCDIESEIWIEFNSLKPLMKIVQSPEDMVAYWAIRTIAGLSMIRKERYCNLLHKEGVIPEFKEIAARSNCVDLSPSLPQLAKIIVQNYESFCSNLEQPMDTT